VRERMLTLETVSRADLQEAVGTSFGVRELKYQSTHGYIRSIPAPQCVRAC
jgi:hypothetical protein